MKCAVLLMVLAPLAIAQDTADMVARGKYLVEEVAKCQDCHTARLATGEQDKAKWMRGAELDFAPTHEMKTWHKTAPDITGGSALFKRWTEKGVTEFLVTAKNPRGGVADPPMPAYKLTRADAEAIVAYLKSLP